MRYRRVDCVNAAGIIISQKNCPRDEKLISAQLCGEACPAQWVPQSWSDVSVFPRGIKGPNRIVVACRGSVVSITLSARLKECYRIGKKNKKREDHRFT